MFDFEQYKLKILTATDGTITRHIIDPVNTENTLALKKERRKLYIVHFSQTILYVGEAHCALQTRLQRGTVPFNFYIKNTAARKGYKGYKWLGKENEHRELTISVAVFNETFDDKGQREFIEAVEGEFVYLTRLKTGYWPVFQIEIHFSNREESKEAALKIWDLLNERL